MSDSDERSIRFLDARVEIDELDDFFDELDSLAEKHNVVIQGFDSRYVASRRHLESAVEKAVRSFERGENIANSLSMEILLYAAGTRQIDVATRMGLDEGDNEAVFVVVDTNSGENRRMIDDVSDVEGVEPAEVEYLDVSVITEFFDISDDELGAVGEEKLELLVLERVSLLEVTK